jgi:hypothetical protein
MKDFKQFGGNKARCSIRELFIGLKIADCCKGPRK